MKRTAPESEREERPAATSQRRDRRESSNDRSPPAGTLREGLGNSAVQALAERGDLRAKLEVGSPDDRYEREADRVAEAVVEGPESTPARGADAVQREPTEAGVDSASDGASGGATVDGDAERRIRSFRGGGRPLPGSERSFFESRFGHDFGDVRVHTSPDADEAARSVNAKAFTLGSDVVFRRGNYEPGTDRGRKLLAHELTHVVQQGAGERVRRQEAEEEEGGRRLGTVHDEATYTAVEDDVQVRSHSVEGWQELLRDADVHENAVELNAFMALSLGESVYLTSGKKSAREGMELSLESMDKPGKSEQVKLMVAMLTTPGVDFDETSYTGVVEAGGYLFKRFVRQNLDAAIQYMVKESWSGEGESLTVDPDAVQTLLNQAGGQWEDVEGLYKETEKYVVPGPTGPRYRIEKGYNEMEKVGAKGEKPGSDPMKVMQAQAMAGAHATVAAAIGEAIELEKQGKANLIEDKLATKYTPRLKNYAKTLKGVYKEQERIASLKKAVIGSAVSVVFAGAGPVAGSLAKTIGKEIGTSAAMEMVKIGATKMGESLAGGGASFKEAFKQGTVEQTKQLKQNYPEDIPDGALKAIRVLKNEFDYQLPK